MAMLSPIHNEADASLLSDEELEWYGTVFIALNRQYSLTDKHHYSFADFLVNPNETAIHQYFANKTLFENRRNGSTLTLSVFLSQPEEMLMAVLNVEAAYNEALALHYESAPLLPKQVLAMQWLDISAIAWFQENKFERFERCHRVMMRGGVYVEPITHYFHRGRKVAGHHR